MDSAIYAPVVIPTLNRFEHLRNCIESLKRCSGADQTEVIINSIKERMYGNKEKKT